MLNYFHKFYYARNSDNYNEAIYKKQEVAEIEIIYQ